MRDGYDGGDIVISAAAGATGVGAAKLFDRAADLGKMAKFLLNRGADASVSAGSQLAKDGEVSLTDTALDVVGGATVGKTIGSAAAGRAERSAANRVLQRQADRAERLGGSNARSSRQEAAASARAAQRGQVSDAAAMSGTAASNATSSANEIRQTMQDREDRR